MISSQSMKRSDRLCGVITARVIQVPRGFLQTQCKSYAHPLQIQCKSYANPMQIQCITYADPVQILCKSFAKVRRVAFPYCCTRFQLDCPLEPYSVNDVRGTWFGLSFARAMCVSWGSSRRAVVVMVAQVVLFVPWQDGDDNNRAFTPMANGKCTARTRSHLAQS